MIHKTTMPEPVAEIRAMAGIEIFDLTDYGKECGLTVGQEFITTAQAEAYKDACVREALEAAAEIADQHNDFSTYDAIRALIPKESA